MAMQKLMTELEKGRRSGEEDGYTSLDDMEKEFGMDTKSITHLIRSDDAK
ncbi:MAG: hypothetical protein ACI4PH_00115 [Faecousia sp.]